MKKNTFLLLAASLLGLVACTNDKSSSKSFSPSDKSVLLECKDIDGELTIQFLNNGTYTADTDMPVSGSWVCKDKVFSADDCEYDAASKTASFTWYNGMFSPSIEFTDSQLDTLNKHGGNPEGLRQGDWGPGEEEAQRPEAQQIVIVF